MRAKLDCAYVLAFVLATVTATSLLAGAACGQEAARSILLPGQIRGPSEEVAGLVVSGRILRNEGKHNAALHLFQEALAKARQTQDHAGEAWALSNIGTVYRYRSAEEKSEELAKKAVEHYEQALAIARPRGDKHNEAYAALYIGVLAAARGRLDEAWQRYEQALPLFTAVDDPYYVARTMMYQGRLEFQRGESRAALALYERSLPLFRKVEMWQEAQEVLADMKAAYERLEKGGKP